MSTSCQAGSPEPTQAAQRADVVIVGGGLTGSCAASALSRQGYDVVVIDTHSKHRPEFRAEKFGDDQMALFERCGIGEAIRAATAVIDGCWLHRFGRIVERGTLTEYSADYSDIVNTLRKAQPSAVRSIVGRVGEVETSADEQTVTLSDGRRFTARLLILSTGLGDSIRKQLGIERVVTSRAHSLVCGFDLANPPASFPFPSLVWTGERFGDRVSYLTLFPMNGVMRANLFVYRSQSEAWSQAMREDPEATMRADMPGLERMFGRLDVKGPVVTRPIDLIEVRNYRHDGVVLLGDAFSTVCPITGTGIWKALTDVDRICHVHLPTWFATPGMRADKIDSFYADPVKQHRDAHSLEISRRAKNMRIETGLKWRARRLRSNVLRNGAYALKGVLKQQQPSASA